LDGWHPGIISCVPGALSLGASSSHNLYRHSGPVATAVGRCRLRELRMPPPERFFRIEVPCDISCDNSWSIGGNHGESRSVIGAEAGPSEAQTRRPQACDLRFLWWPGAGSNRRPSDFQSEFDIGFANGLAADTAVCCPVTSSSFLTCSGRRRGCGCDSTLTPALSREAGPDRSLSSGGVLDRCVG
jgi:hypothetical protein